MYAQDYENAQTPDAHAAEINILDLVNTGDWLDAQTFPPLQWAVYGLIPQGFGLLTGPPKAGKSWCGLGIGLAISSGTNALGKVPTGEPRPVLYLALEDGNARLQWRARQLLREGEAIPALLHTVTNATPEQVIPLIQAWLDRYGSRKPLVLLDTLGKVMPPSRPGESAYQRDYRIGSRLKSLADAHTGSTLLVIHHIRKAAGEDWMDSTSGTNGLNGAADFTINLSRSRNTDAGVIRVTGRDVPESEFAVTSSDGNWVLDGSTLADAAKAAEDARSTADLGDRSAEIVALVNTSPGGVTPAQVASAAGISADQASAYLGRLVKADRINRPSRGLYTRVGSVGSVGIDSETNTPNTTNTPRLMGEAALPLCPCHGRVYCPVEAA